MLFNNRISWKKVILKAETIFRVDSGTVFACMASNSTVLL
jgi:hypothetical protein